jgi:glycolate oxidase FAD binding subunit
MSESIARQLAAAIGDASVNTDGRGRVVAVPGDTDAVARIMAIAAEAAWHVVVTGAGTWAAGDPPGDLTLSLRGLDAITAVRAGDLVLSTGAGATVDALRRAAMEAETWLPLDPPGRGDRTIGSVLATATSGPLRHGFGPVRDHVLGLTVVTGDGRVVHSGGTTVKNVAGFDLAKLHVGGFGGFGIITECHLRLRGLPRADTTWMAIGHRDQLRAAAGQLTDARIEAVAVELCSPALAVEADWMLAVRLIGGHEAVAAESRRLAEVTSLTWQELSPDRRAILWSGMARAMTSADVTVRLGALPDGLDDVLDLLLARLGEGLVSVGAATGSVRWSGSAGPEVLRAFRAELAPREIPLTLERAPWATRRAVGHFGAYHEGVGGLIAQLRDSFDPHTTLVSTLDATMGT